MVNRDYTKEVDLPSYTRVLSRPATFSVLAVVAALICFGVVRVVGEARPGHAPSKAASAAGSH